MLRENGFLEKIRVNNQLYKFGGESINLQYLRTPDPKHLPEEYNYVKYILDDNTPEFERYQKKIELAVGDMETVEEKKAFRRKMKIPWEIKISLKLNKSSLEIDKINIDRFSKL